MLTTSIVERDLKVST